MEKENLYIIHGEDYLRHIEEKLELLWMATILMHYIKNGAEKDGYPAYGYKRDPEDKHHLVIDEETAPTVRRIFAMRAAGMGFRTIAVTLNEEGVLPPGALYYLDLVRRSTLDFDERCEEMFSSWGRALNYLKSHDLADLSDLIENDLIEPEYAGYIPADNPCCPGERCCEYAERIEREYAAEREADEDNEDADVFEYDGEPAISELTGVCRDILTAVEGLTTLLRDEFDYAD